MKVTLETRRLVESGIIDEPTEQAIIGFAAKMKNGRAGGIGKLSVMLAVLAALLVGAGAIMLLAHNWSDLPFAVRLVIAFVPLTAGVILGGFTLFAKRGAAMRESSCVLIIAGIAAALALVSQLYHINGELEDFIIAVMVMSIPFIYVFGSAAGIAAAAGMMWPLAVERSDWVVAALFLALLPAIVYHLHKYRANVETGVWRLAMVSLIFSAAFPFTTRLHYSVIPAMLGTVFAAILAFGMSERRGEGVTFLRSPGLFFGFAALAILLAVAANPELNHTEITLTAENMIATLNRSLWLPALFWLFTLKNAVSDRTAAAWLLVAAFPGILFCPGIYTGALAVALLVDGARKNLLLPLNAGMMLAIILIFDIFFYKNDTVMRGCFFIGAGLALAIVNLLLVKKFGETKNA
ncbi:MAG: DUF2157 domain-containing protein [Victivallaceae bacterium]|nr:DUF2157 domain-containing protein [Victivallaceae bacterium]